MSHDKIALQSICDRAILLEGGAIVRDGDPESVLDYYNALIAQKEGEVIETLEHPSGRIQTISGSRKAVITDVGLHDLSGKALDTVAVATPVELRVAVQAAVASLGLASSVNGSGGIDVALRLAHAWSAGMNLSSHVVLEARLPAGGAAPRRYHGFGMKVNGINADGEYMTVLNVAMHDALKKLAADLRSACSS